MSSPEASCSLSELLEEAVSPGSSAAETDVSCAEFSAEESAVSPLFPQAESISRTDPAVSRTGRIRFFIGVLLSSAFLSLSCHE